MPSTKKPAPAGKRSAAKRTGKPPVKKEARPRSHPATAAHAAPAGAAAPASTTAPAGTTAPESGTVEAAPRRSRRKAAGAVITIEQYGSGIGCIVRHKRTLKALGLRRPRQRVVRPDNPAVRGMVQSIPHLARIVEGA